MGQDEEREHRLRDLAGYGIDDDLVARAGDDVIVMHCLPAHYGEEITEAVLYGRARLSGTRPRTACMLKRRCSRS
jgi:ornithine carbamoyltransferase